MAVNVGTGYIDIRGDFSQLNRDLSGRKLAGRFAKAGLAIGGALAGGIAFEAKRSVEAFYESNKIAKQTQAVLKSTGGAANVTAKGISNLATAISRKTGVDDESIQSGENLLLTFTKVRNEAGKGNDVFTQSTKIVTDMSVALGQDMKSSAVQVGKALNDPIKGVTALQRVGVSFTAQQKEQIKTLVASGKTLDAQKFILRELNKEFGGSAAAQATGMEKLKVAAGNLEEDLGSGLAPAVDAVTGKLTKLAIDVEPQVIRAVDRIAKAFGRKDLSLDQKFRLSYAEARKVFEPLIAEGRASVERMNLGEKIPQAVEYAMPKVADAMARAAPRTAEAFVHAFMAAGPWGRLAIGGWLLMKMGGLGAFTKLGRQASTAMAAGAATSGAAGAAAGAGGAGLGAKLLGGARTAGYVAAIATIPLLFKETEKAAKPAQEALKAFNDNAARSSGIVETTKRVDGLIRQIRALGREKGATKWGQQVADELEKLNSPITGVIHQIDRMAKSGSGDFKSLATNVRLNTRAIKRTVGDNTDAARDLMARNFQAAAAAVKRAMDSGAVSTREGTALMNQYLRQALAQFGIKGDQATRYLQNRDTKTGKPLTPKGNAGAGHQRGGPISGGAPSGDTIPALLERGEYVLNREAVKSVGRRVLDRINFGVAPRFQTGGAVLPRVNVRDDLGTVSTLAQRAVDIDRAAAQDVLKAARAAFAATAAGGGGETSTTGLVGQVLRALAWARAHGWHGSVTSGFRSRAAQAVLYARFLAGTGNRAAPPGSSSHEKGQAVDVTDTEAFAAAMAGAPGNARLLRLVPGEPWHFSVTGHQLGGLVGMQNGGFAGGSWMLSPWRRALTAHASSGSLGRGLRKVVRAKSPKLRHQAVAQLLDRVKKAGLPAKLAGQLKRHSGDVEKFADYADRAAVLTTTDADGNPIPAVVGGKTQAQWLQDELAALFAWRNALVRAQAIIHERRAKIIAAISEARKRLAEVVGRLRVARKHPKANKEMIKRLTGARDALKDRVLPALTGKSSSLKTLRGDIMSSLTDVQGVGSPMKVMPKLPDLGVFGGQILQVQTSLRDLTGEAPSKITDPSSGAGDDERVGLLEQLLRESNLRTAVSERQFDVLRNMPPYGGAFKDGGVVPGPVGAPRMILAHGGETVTPVGRDGPRVRVVVEDHRTRVFVDDIEQVVERVTRRQARAGARALPGRGGGVMR